MSGIQLASSAPELYVLPLGGCGEVGLNATLIADGSDAILIDCGVLLSVPDAPGVERVIPDFELLKRNGRKLHGVVITHGHEDHIGAVPDLLRFMDVPVYGPPLAMMLLESRLEGQGARRLNPIPLGGRFKLGPFEIELVRMTHSLPDAAALFIETRAGRVFHSGDFKLDDTPIDGRLTDVERLRELGQLGVDLAFCDSTNAERHGHTRSEAEVGIELERIARETEGRLVVACFASHLHRLEGIARAAEKSGRTIALFGRSLHRSWDVGTRAGHLSREAVLISDDAQLERLDKKKTLLVVTGTQGEPRAALAKLAFAPTRAFSLGPGDRLVLSATAIPGNERAVRRVVNAISSTGAEVVQDGMRPVHCSGHAHREEQLQLLSLIRPRHFVPVHGERAMLEAHARTAKQAGVPGDGVLLLENGDGAILCSGRLVRGPEEEVGRRAIDSASGREISWDEVAKRRKIGFAGVVFCSVAVGPDGFADGRPKVSLVGLPFSGGLDQRLGDLVIEGLSDGYGAEELRALVKRTVRDALGVKPSVEVHLIRTGAGPSGG